MASTSQGNKRKCITDFFTLPQSQKPKKNQSGSTPKDPNDPFESDGVCGSTPTEIFAGGDGAAVVGSEGSNVDAVAGGDDVSSLSLPVPDFQLLPPNSNDIGHYIGKRPHDSKLKELIENPWVPSNTYDFPFSIHNKKGKNERRFVGIQHLQKYDWLVLSHKDRGLYCKYCPFFNTGGVAGHTKATQLRALVTEPLLKFSKLTGKEGDLESHNGHHYHISATDSAREFIRTMKKPETNILNQVDTQRMRQVRENRERLLCALQNVIFLARQNVPLRGHRESGNLDSSNSNNEGNFRELLKFRKECGDKIVEQHLASASHRNMYTSKIIQNDIIECCGFEIVSKILERVKESKFYSIIFDETTDISHTSQLSLSLRYVHVEEGDVKGIREDFLLFVDPREVLSEVSLASCNQEFQENLEIVEENDEDSQLVDMAHSDSDSGDDESIPDTDDESIPDTDDESIPDTDDESIPDTDDDSTNEDEEEALTGVKLGQVVMKLMRDHGLDPNYCVGIGTDGCSVNASDTCGAIQEIQKEAVNAVRSPCFNHSLNLSLSKSSSVPSVKKAIAIMKEVGSFFRSSSKKHRRLKKRLNRTLPKLCETRWVERHDAILVFFEEFKKIIEVLETISNWKDAKTAAKASSLVSALHESEFIITLVCLRDLLSQTISLSRLLQRESIELQQASDAVTDTLSVLDEKRLNAEEIFGVLFDEASNLAEHLDIELKRPKASGRGRHPTSSVISYYRQAVFCPMLDNVILDLKDRFSPEVLGCYNLNYLLPGTVLASDPTRVKSKISTLAKKYCGLFGKEAASLEKLLEAELALWTAKWKRAKLGGETVPNSVLEGSDICDKELYPTIRNLLFILATLPSSVATAERTFSSLRRIKTWLRSTMVASRLNGLALMGIHRDIPIIANSVMDRFAAKNETRTKKLII